MNKFEQVARILYAEEAMTGEDINDEDFIKAHFAKYGNDTYPTHFMSDISVGLYRRYLKSPAKAPHKEIDIEASTKEMYEYLKGIWGFTDEELKENVLGGL